MPQNRDTNSLPSSTPEGIFDDTRSYRKRTKDGEEAAKSTAEKFAKIANVFSISRCMYCESKNIVKRGLREKKHERVQLYLCRDCTRTFTGQKIKGKQYPARLILDGVSYYNVGFSYEQSTRFLALSYGLKVDGTTLAGWVKEFADVCAYGRMRPYGLKLFSPNQIIQSSKMMHRQMYHFRYHRAKMALVLEEYKHYRFTALKELLDSVVDECPHQLFQNSARSSEIKQKFNLDQVRITQKRNYAVLLAELVLQAVTDNKLRHETLQKFMIANDSVTVATELPIYLDKEDIRYMREELKFEIPFDIDQYLTGHIDLVQVRNGAVHILDYKPNAEKEYPITQLTIYALALSRLTGLRLYEFRCAWFDDKNYYEFFPLHVVLKKTRRARKIRNPNI